jgi:hypothetical protein
VYVLTRHTETEMYILGVFDNWDRAMDAGRHPGIADPGHAEATWFPLNDTV